jgi:hypothetical protein
MQTVDVSTMELAVMVESTQAAVVVVVALEEVA